MDVCNRSERIFDAVGKFASKTELRDLSAKIREAILQFGFELQKELRRVNTSNDKPVLGDLVQTVKGNELQETSKRSLEQTVEAYHSVLETHLPAHSRAMIRRQCSQLEELYQDLCKVSRAA